MTEANEIRAKSFWGKAAIAVLLGGHLCLYVVYALLGEFDPFEFFNVLLLISNFVIAAILYYGDRDVLIGGGIMFLIATHAFIGHRLAPDYLTSGAILMVNILVLYVGVKVNQHLPRTHWYAFVASYFALYGIFIVSLNNSEALFLLFLLGMAACARSLRLISYFWAFTLCFTFFQPYAWESLLLSFFLLTAVFFARGGVNKGLAKFFLATGLTVLFLVFLPITIAVMGEEILNIQPVIEDVRIRAAIGRTFLTATLATLILAAFVVPLTYAMSRLKFPGRTLLLSLMDLPVVIPQSVAGIALVTALGRNQFLGQLIESNLGIAFDNTLVGIVTAQVFVALPFIAKASYSAFEAIPVKYEQVAATLRAKPFESFRRVTLPLASRGIIIGAVLSWARAAGEFGAVVILAPSPETAPVEAYRRFVSVGATEAAPLAVVLVLFSLVMFFLLQASIRFLPRSAGGEA
ncbi:MAG: ABC transporter permease [Planctomycetota bacterium]|nr:ABC transporter permease [Planctomycetota bacterium]